MLVERFYPDEYLDSTYSIDFDELAAEGYKGVLFDIDNTLVPHGAPADDRAKRLFAHLGEIGMDYCVISNNQLPRVKPFADAVQAKYIEDAHKPSTRNYKKAMQMMGCDEKNSLFVGDQLFTDVWGAKRAGMRTILVKPIHPKEEIQIVLKRYLEKNRSSLLSESQGEIMIKKILQLMDQEQVEALLVSDGYNMRYLSGFCGAAGYLYISAKQQVLMTDSRYTTQAEKEAPQFQVVEVGGSQGYPQWIASCIQKDGIKTIGFEDQQMICAEFKKISSQASGDVQWKELGEKGQPDATASKAEQRRIERSPQGQGKKIRDGSGIFE